MIGLELSSVALRKCKEENVNVYNQSIEDYALTNAEAFDVVTSFQVLEHVPTVKDFLDASLKVLKKKGFLILGVPRSEPYIYKTEKYNTLNTPPHHMGLWESDTFKALEKYFPIKLIKIHYQPYPYGIFLYDKLFPLKIPLFKGLFYAVFNLLYNFFVPFEKRKHSHTIVAIFQKTS